MVKKDEKCGEKKPSYLKDTKATQRTVQRTSNRENSKVLSEMKEQPKKLNILQKFARWYTTNKKRIEENRKDYESQVQHRKTQTVKDLEEQSKEDSEDDGIFSEGDEWFPEEM